MYRQSLLGYVWILLPPLFTSLIWIFLNDQQLVVGDTGGAAAPMFILTGTVLWTAFNTAVIGMQGIMGEARSVLSKINFPHEALIISAFLKTVMNALLPALILIPAALTYGIEVGTSACLFPLGFLTLLLSGAAIGLFLVPVASLYSDIGRGIQLGLRFGFFATPVLFALPKSGLVRNLFLCNPATAPLVSSRSSLLGSGPELWGLTLLIAVLSLALFAVSTLVFKITMPTIIERLNA